MSVIPILYSFARSGGTLVNQLLGTHPRCLVLSEVNPAASYKPVAEQAVEWLQLAAADERDSLSAMPYRRQIGLLRERAAERDRVLVVRDWVTVNFLEGTAQYVAASGALEQALYLEREGLRPLPLVVTRRAEAVYASVTKNFANMSGLARDAFAKAYLAYARAVAPHPRLHMESLRAAPEAGVKKLLEHFGLDTAATAAVVRDFHQFTRCTGNTTLQGRGGSAMAERVLPPEPEGASSDALLAEADRLLGYDC